MAVSYMHDYEWDKKLKIETIGRKDSHADAFHHPYEPTPYAVLERLAKSGYIRPDDILVDYGCGKGRVGFFLTDRVGCRTIGVEYDEEMYQKALQNLKDFPKKKKMSFHHGLAEKYKVEDETCFFFFNPFTVEFLRMVIPRILESYHEDPRSMRLFFYYPDEEYMSYLLIHPELEYLEEIDCRDLFDEWDNVREAIAVFKVMDIYG